MSRALRLTVFVDDTDVWHHRPMYTEERVRAFLPDLDDLSIEGLAVLDEVEVVHHRGRQAAP